MTEQILQYPVLNEDGSRTGQSITITLMDHGERVDGDEDEGHRGWGMHLDVNGYAFTKKVTTGDKTMPKTLVENTVPDEYVVPAGGSITIALSKDGVVTISKD